MSKAWQFVLSFIIAWWLLAITILMAQSQFKPNKPAVDQHAVIPPPIHIEWQRFDASDHFIVAPPDGTTTPRPFIKLPPGSMLLIPRLVKGESPEQKKSKT